MDRLLLTTLNVLAFSIVAGWFTRRRWVALLGGTAISLGLFMLIVGTWGPDLLWATAAVPGSAAGLLAMGWGLDQLRRRGMPHPPPASPAIAFLRHWRGEGGLPSAFLRFVALLGAASLAMGGLGAAPMDTLPRGVAGAIVASWGAAFVLFPWSLVGLWRAAGRHVAEGGRRVVAWPARLLAVAAGILFGGVVAFDAAPDLREYAPIAFGPPHRDRYAIRLLRGGTELELSGELAWGVGADFEAALTANPAVRVVHLDSGGGKTFEGRRLAGSVRARKLTTYVARHCESACVWVFAAGEERLLSRRAVIGLHRPSGHNVTRARLKQSSAEEIQYLASRGVERAFAERGQATPAEEMWHPTHEEILRSGLATRTARADEVALSGYTAADVEALDLKLRERRWFQALFEFERPLFDRVVAGLREGIREGRSEAEALPFLDEETSRVLDRYFPRTTDAAAHGFYVAFVAAGRAAREQGDQACADYLERERARGPIPAIEPAVEERFLDAIADVVAGAALEPMHTPSESEVQGTLAQVAFGLGDRAHLLDVLEDERAHAERPGEFCEATLAIAEGIVALHPAEAGPLVRFLTSQQAAAAPSGP